MALIKPRVTCKSQLLITSVIILKADILSEKYASWGWCKMCNNAANRSAKSDNLTLKHSLVPAAKTYGS